MAPTTARFGTAGGTLEPVIRPETMTREHAKELRRQLELY